MVFGARQLECVWYLGPLRQSEGQVSVVRAVSVVNCHLIHELSMRIVVKWLHRCLHLPYIKKYRYVHILYILHIYIYMYVCAYCGSHCNMSPFANFPCFRAVVQGNYHTNICGHKKNKIAGFLLQGHPHT